MQKNNKTRTSHSQFAPSGALPYNNQTALCLYLKMLIKNFLFFNHCDVLFFHHANAEL